MNYLMVIFTAKPFLARLNMFLFMLQCSFILLFTGQSIWFGEKKQSSGTGPIDTKGVNCQVFEMNDTNKIHEFNNN